LLFNRRINKRPFLSNGSVDTPVTIENLLKAVFFVEPAPKICNEDPRPAALLCSPLLCSALLCSAERIIERQLRVGSAVELGKGG
jgi:hypothetical protein